jgi:hypothetical protein
MSDDETQEERLGRIQRWAENLRDVLKDGDEIVVRLLEGQVQVEESAFSKFQAAYPRLWGRLSSLDAQMETGCGLYVAAFVGVSAVCVGIHRQWWLDALGADLNETLDAWWFYLVLFGLAVFAASQAYEWQERRVYRRGRAELHALMADETLDRDTLLPLLADSPELERVIKQLKLDPGPFPAAKKLRPYEETP